MCVFVGCRGLLVLSIAAACCWTATGQGWSSSSTSFSSSSYSGPPYDLPCVLNGKFVLHGTSKQLTECSHCVCDNSTVTCQFIACPPLLCSQSQRIKLEGKCCKICPNKVTVKKVVPLVHPHTSLEQGKENQIAMDLQVKYLGATNALGQGLWTMRLWMSSSEDGTSELSGTVLEEALSEGQQSQSLTTSSSGTLVFEDVRYRFDLTDHTCADAAFICAKFNKGRNPEMEKVNIPFNFSSRPSEDVLTSCVANQYCHASTTPVPEDVDSGDGRKEIPPSSDCSLYSLLLQVEQERLAETRKMNEQFADLISIMETRV